MASNPPEGIPPDVREFLTREINSIEQLEILLLLRRTSPRRWTPSEVSTELRGNVDSARHRLELLAASRIVLVHRGAPSAPEGRTGVSQGDTECTYSFDASSRSLDELVASLDSVYSQRRVRVIEFIFTKPTDPLRDFADAFKLRKE